ncbi:MAG: WD40 repeat domain-containing protein, partial [Bacteroidetes bacterium]
ASSEQPVMVETLQWTADQALQVRSADGEQLVVWTPAGFRIETDQSGTISASTSTGALAKAVHNYIIIEKPNARLLEGHAAAVTDLQWTPDGRFLVSQTVNGELGLWSPDQSQPLAVLKLLGESPATKYLLWQADGSFFVPGLSKAVVLPPSDLAAEEAPLDLNPEAVMSYGLFKLIDANEAVLAHVIAGGDTTFKSVLADIYDKRAALNPDPAAAAADRRAAERLRAAQ